MLQQKLKDFLSSLTKKELTEIRQYWQFEGISQLNKAELIETLDQKIKDNLKNWLSYQLPRNINFLEMVITKQTENERVEVKIKDILPPALYNFYYRGILDLVDEEEEISVRIPTDLAEEIEKISSEPEFKNQIKQNERHKNFACGLLAYYGALTADKLIKFYDQYFEAGEDPEEFFRFLMLVQEIYLSTYYLERHNNYYLDPGVLKPEKIIAEKKDQILIIISRVKKKYFMPVIINRKN